MTQTSEYFVALYDIRVDGAAIDADLAARTKDIRIVDNLRLPDTCTFSVLYEAPDELDAHPFEIGSKLEIRLGAMEDISAKPIFKGEVVTVEARFGSGSIQLDVRAYDRSHRLQRSRRTRTFQNMTVSDVVEKVLGEGGFRASCQSSGGAHEFIQQTNETDWDFIWRLGDRIGFELLIEDTNAKFGPPDSKGEPIELMWGESLRSFTPRLTAVQQVQLVTVLAFDPKTKREITGRASSPTQLVEIGVERNRIANAFPGGMIHVATEPVKSQDEANKMAKALLDRVANAYVSAEGLAFGNPDIKAGRLVKVTGVGSKFGGTYRVASSTHLLGRTYETKFSNAPVHTISGAAGGGGGKAGLDLGMQLVIGLVTNNKDPDGMGRVRVYYPALGTEYEGFWARVAVPSAGKERGLMMLPVVNEEVLVGFEHGDTTRPYVIGSLFNGKDTPGTELAAKDGSFGLRSDKKLIMRAKEEIEISGDKSMKVTIKQDVEEKFDANWKEQVARNGELKIGGNLTIEATGTVKIKGGPSMNIESSGPMKLKAAQMDIDGGAMLNLKGGLINIG
jgi:phage protein D